MRFTFNKKARRTAEAAIRKLEGGSMATAVLGSFSAKPQVTAISSALLFVVCRIVETILAGIEDDDIERPSRKSTKVEKAARPPANDDQKLDTG